MNSGYNPVLFTPKYTSTHQMKSQQKPHYMGGSQIISGLGITATAPIQAKVVKPSKIHFPR